MKGKEIGKGDGMRFHGHVAAGAAFFGLAWTAGMIPDKNWGPAVAATACFVGTMVPDLDHTGSKLGRVMLPLSWVLSRFSGHGSGRRGAVTHSLVAMAVFTLLWAAGTAAVAESLFPRSPWFMQASVVGFMVGYFSHLFADCLTKGGTPLLWFPGIGRFPSLNGGRLALTSMRTGGAGEFMASAAFLAVAGLALFA